MVTTPRGFIKEVGGVMRMRWVRPPHNANTLTLAQNLVVFDSTAVNIFGVLVSGIWTGTITGTPTRIVSWGSPGYIPLVRFWSSTQGAPTTIRPYLPLSGDPLELMMESDATGIVVSTNSGLDTIPCVLRYIAFRMPC